ncbi:hypothetical protein MHYP_G00341390 [Metynnis hypsauchen]
MHTCCMEMVLMGHGTVTLHAHDGPLVVYAPAGGQDGGSFFPDIWEKEHKTGMNPPKQPGPTKFPPLPVKSRAGNSSVCQGVGINTGSPVKCHVLPKAGETLADKAVFRKPQLSRSSRKSILVQAGAPVPKPQLSLSPQPCQAEIVSSLDFSIQGVAVPLKPRERNPAGNEDMKIPGTFSITHPSAKPSSSAVSPPRQTADCTSQQAESAHRSAVDLQTNAIHLVQVVQLSSTTMQQSQHKQHVPAGEHNAQVVQNL